MFVTVCFRLSERLAAEFEAVGVVDDPVEDGICEGGFTDHVVPGRERQLIRSRIAGRAYLIEGGRAAPDAS